MLELCTIQIRGGKSPFAIKCLKTTPSYANSPEEPKQKGRPKGKQRSQNLVCNEEIIVFQDFRICIQTVQVVYIRGFMWLECSSVTDAGTFYVAATRCVKWHLHCCRSQELRIVCRRNIGRYYRLVGPKMMPSIR